MSIQATDWADLFARLSIATAAGAILGLERSRQNRAIMGFRTLALVGLASCIAVEAILDADLPRVNTDAAARVIQGILSGVGFIGAGALLHDGNSRQVHGLATAASIWVAAALGAASALAQWPLIALGLVLALLILMIGPPVERHIRNQARRSSDEEDRREIEADRGSAPSVTPVTRASSEDRLADAGRE